MRQMVLVPTESMTADSLTMSMQSLPMFALLSTGLVKFKNEEKHPVW